jgi:hypothetical protein
LQEAEAGRVTATPAKHGVYEVTFVLHIRPAGNMQVVMNAQEAADLTAML